MVDGDLGQVHRRISKHRYHGTALSFDQLRDGFASCIDLVVLAGVGEKLVADLRQSQRQHQDLSGDPNQDNAHARGPDPWLMPSLLGWRIMIGRKGWPATHLLENACCNWMLSLNC